MALPLPNPAGAGGGILDAMNALDESRKNQLMNVFQQMKNKYYGPNIESEMANRNALTKGYDIANQYAPERLRLANQQSQQNLDWNPKIWGSEIANRNALTNKTNQMLPYDIENQKNINEWYARKAQSDIEANKAMAEYRRLGGGGGGRSAGSGDEMRYHATVKDYNPDLLPDQLREAADAYAEGRTSLNDGTPLAPINPTLQRSLDRAFKSSTTAPLITQGVRANAAESEMPVLDKYISAGRTPYGDTVFGKSPLQIKDTFDVNNKAAQNRLGDYIAADLLTFDKAALQTRIAGTESGVTIINEVMSKSKQAIDAKYPTLSNAARQRALETVGKALKEALAARNRYGIGASSATGKRGSSLTLKPVSEMTTQEIEQELSQLGGAK